MEKKRNGSDILYDGLIRKVEEYRNAIKNIGFAESEYDTMEPDPQTPEELLETVCRIIETSKELNLIVEQSPSSIYVSDVDMNTLRINKSFEDMTGIKRSSLIGRNNNELEREDIFNPSVCSLALREGRRVVVQQHVNDDRSFITAGVPILDENGEIFRVITNALLSEDEANMSAYFQEKKEQGSRKIEKPGRIIAESRQMREVLNLADLVKDTESTIIIEGETGVGKSMLARYIHNTSNRSEKKMMEINCGAIPEALLESELFGYVSGAFTGADRKGKAGLIEACEGGTLLLDEISELPLLLQVKLLHFLQNRKITRVGGTEEIPVNVRVIAATNKNLEMLVEKGEFRQDLYYRLNVIPIVIPPLRERKDDIMPAVRYFVDKFTKLYNKKLPIDEKCVDFFSGNEWKGNLRELENCVERLVVTEGKVSLGTVTGADSADSVGSSCGESKQGSRDQGDVPEKLRAQEAGAIRDLEKEMIIEAYNRYGSSYKVAEALGISQSTAYRKIKKYIGGK